MQVAIQELVNDFRSKGHDFENLMNSVLRSSARAIGISPNSIEWDYRTNIGDGGRDIIINAEHASSTEFFIPGMATYWSLKSGENGKSTSLYKKEVKSHPRIVDWLLAGKTFVWCALTPLSNDERKDLIDAAADVIKELNEIHKSTINTGQFEFRWNTDIVEELNLHPGVMWCFFPTAATRFKCVATLEQWKNCDPSSSPWVNIGDRDAIIDQLVDHLSSNASENLLFIAGLSGIGKTRLVREAAETLNKSQQQIILYVEHYEKIKDDFDFIRYFARPDVKALLVIDEISHDDAIFLKHQFQTASDRVRLICIGPAKRQRPSNIGNKIILREPETDEDVFAILKASGSSLSDELLRNIAKRSNHDLRLANILKRTCENDPDNNPRPFVDSDDIWNRVTRLYNLTGTDLDRLTRTYEATCCFIDVGHGQRNQDEMKAIAKWFSMNEIDLRAGFDIAHNIGFGVMTRNHFEAGPRALASLRFAHRTWRHIRNNVNAFLDSLPERLENKFLERCHDCPNDIIEEVRAGLGRYFLGLLENQPIGVLEDVGLARVFANWTEFDPPSGLRWLRQTVDRATLAELTEFRGDDRRFGGYGGRRHIVWLCEALAQFEDYFEDCEAVLFRLAVAENEKAIGNNSTEIWKGLFHLPIAFTEVSFDRRLDILIHRLNHLSEPYHTLVVNCAIDLFGPMTPSNPLPPEFVGGVLAPNHWRPISREAYLDIRRYAASRILDALSKQLEQSHVEHAVRRLAKNLIIFLSLNLLPEIRSVTDLAKDEEAIFDLLAEIDGVLEMADEHPFLKNSDSLIPKLETWKTEISPKQLSERIRQLTSQNYWDIDIRKGGAKKYDRLAEEIIADPRTIDSLSDWFSSPLAISAYSLGVHVGKLDTDCILDEAVIHWIDNERADQFVVGYLAGVSGRSGRLPQEWANALDHRVTKNPMIVANATLMVDFTQSGFRRLLQAHEAGYKPAWRLFAPIGMGEWLDVLRVEQKLIVADILGDDASNGEPYATSVALDLFSMWSHTNNDSMTVELARKSLSFLELALTTETKRPTHSWLRVALRTTIHFPVEVGDMVLRSLTQYSGGMRRVSTDHLMEVLKECAKARPSDFMDRIGQVLADHSRRSFFDIYSFVEVFQSIGAFVVGKWIDQNGIDRLSEIARHFPKPQPYGDGHVVLDDLTRWLFVEHESNQKAFESFLRGRASNAVWTNEESLQEKTTAFRSCLKHPMRRVRDWAAHEIAEAKRLEEVFEDLDDRDRD